MAMPIPFSGYSAHHPSHPTAHSDVPKFRRFVSQPLGERKGDVTSCVYSL